MTKTTVGMIGLGAMGYQMARHMVAKGFDVCGIDVQNACNARAKAAGVKVVETPVEAGARPEIVVVMVATDPQVEDVIVKSGLLDRLAKGSVICVASSCSVNTAQELEKIGAATPFALHFVEQFLGDQTKRDDACVF